MRVARIFHESSAATADLTVLSGVLGCRTLRRTVQVRLGSNPAVPRDELPGCTAIFTVSRRQFVIHQGELVANSEVRTYFVHRRERKERRENVNLR